MDSGTGMSKILIREFQYNSQVPSSPFPSAHFPVEKFSGKFLESLPPDSQKDAMGTGDWGPGVRPERLFFLAAKVYNGRPETGDPHLVVPRGARQPERVPVPAEGQVSAPLHLRRRREARQGSCQKIH